MKKLCLILYSLFSFSSAQSTETFSISISAKVIRHQTSAVLSAGPNSLTLSGSKEYPLKVYLYKHSRGRSIASTSREEITVDSTQSIDLINKNIRKIVIESP